VDATLSCAHEIAGEASRELSTEAAGRAAVLRPAKARGQSPPTPGSFAFYRLRDDGILQVICPTRLGKKFGHFPESRVRFSP